MTEDHFGRIFVMGYYEYTPQNRSTAEKTLVFLALLFAAATFGVSLVKDIPYPAIFQFFAVVFLAAAFVIANKSLLRSYTYTVTEPNGQGECDFLITEHYGKRHAAVCRVGLAQVVSAVTVSVREKERIRTAERAANVIYRYLTPLFPSEVLLVTLRTGDAITLLRLQSDKDLEKTLLSRQQQ